MAGPFTLVPSAARTASGNSGPLALADTSILDLEVAVTAITGTTPSFTFSVLAAT
jgi:hypothetical protein